MRCAAWLAELLGFYPFDTLPSSGGSAPAFRICTHCGFGYSIDRETA